MLAAQKLNLLYRHWRPPTAHPVLDFHLQKLNTVLPKSANGQAIITYTLIWRPRLKRYLNDNLFTTDKTFIENSIHLVTPGRKNYMFAGFHSLPCLYGDAVQQAVILYSLLATCKINNVESFEWLSKTLSVISDLLANQLFKLLPG